MKKILHVVAGMDPKMGGVCQAVRNLIKGLENLQTSNEVVSLDEPNAPYIEKDRFPIHAIGSGVSTWAYNNKLKPWFRDNLCRFNIIILHGLWLYPNYSLHKVLKKYKANEKQKTLPNVFIMPHGMLDPYFQNAPGRRLKSLRNWAYWKLIEGDVVNDADGILFTCGEEQRLAKEPFSHYNPKRETVVGMGVEDPPAFTPVMTNLFLKNFHTLKNKPYILFLGRINEKKGVDILIKSYAEIWKTRSKSISADRKNSFAEDLNHEPPVLVIAGPGLDTPFGRSMIDLASSSMLPEGSILFSGMLTGDLKWGAFYGCEAFILPSHQENFGIAVVEAMACGRPVLISNQVNIWSEIRSEGAGIIGEDELLGTYQMIKSWLSVSEEEKVAMGRRARECFEKQFNIGVNAKRYLNAINL